MPCARECPRKNRNGRRLIVTYMRPQSWPDGSLPAILERFMYVHTVDPVKWWPGGTEITTVSGTMIGPETVGDTGADLDALIGSDHQSLVYGLARATRESMYRQAEDAIAAAGDAGWVIAEHPEIDMRGTINRDRETDMRVPCAECRVRLAFRRPAGYEQQRG
jgi:hypothetical protein